MQNAETTNTETSTNSNDASGHELFDLKTGDCLGLSTIAQKEASDEAAKHDNGVGAFDIDGVPHFTK